MEKLPVLAVLVSGNGTNLQSIIDHIHEGKLRAVVGAVISDNENAFALERAKKANIPGVVIQRKEFQTKSHFEKAIHDEVRRVHAEMIVLAGFMRILSAEFVEKYPNRILNIHPSLLPNHPGLHAIEKAFEAKDEFAGVTIHFVDRGVDTGPIVLQDKVKIDSTDTIETLTQKVHALEHQLYPKAIQKVLWGK